MMNKSILVVAAHPDDEALGCGGTIAKHTSNGDDVHVLIITEGVTSRDYGNEEPSRADKLKKLSYSAQKANDILGVKSLKILGFPDNRLDSIDRLDVIKAIEEHASKIAPQIIYSHSDTDLNIDHRIVNEAVLTAFRPIPNSTIEKIFFFEVPSSTGWNQTISANNFIANSFEDISSTLSIKLKSLKEYEMEMRDWPHARSLRGIEYLAKYRGALVGLEAAEAFYLARNIIRK